MAKFKFTPDGPRPLTGVRPRTTTTATGQQHGLGGKSAGSIAPPRNATVRETGSAHENSVPARIDPTMKPVRETDRANTTNPIR